TEALARHQGNVSRAAEGMGMYRQHLQLKLSVYAIAADCFRARRGDRWARSILCLTDPTSDSTFSLLKSRSGTPGVSRARIAPGQIHPCVAEPPHRPPVGAM